MKVTWNPVSALCDVALLVALTLLTGSLWLGFLGVLAAYVVYNVRNLVER